MNNRTIALFYYKQQNNREFDNRIIANCNRNDRKMTLRYSNNRTIEQLKQLKQFKKLRNN